jgi:hypothetical protein
MRTRWLLPVLLPVLIVLLAIALKDVFHGVVIGRQGRPITFAHDATNFCVTVGLYLLLLGVFLAFAAWALWLWWLSRRIARLSADLRECRGLPGAGEPTQRDQHADAQGPPDAR